MFISFNQTTFISLLLVFSGHEATKDFF